MSTEICTYIKYPAAHAATHSVDESDDDDDDGGDDDDDDDGECECDRNSDVAEANISNSEVVIYGDVNSIGEVTDDDECFCCVESSLRPPLK